MARARTVFACRDCGGETPRWQGQCPHCQAWNTLTEFRVEGGRNRAAENSLAPSATVQRLADVKAESWQRIPSGLGEFDRVLGGGFVPGAVVLLGGDPGIGKSTLLLQSLAALSQRQRVLYVTGEESAEQVADRARRLQLSDAGVELLAETRLQTIQAALLSHAPQLVVIDSIQTLYSDELEAAPGSVSQVRECAAQLTRLAKAGGPVMVLVGHVTKEGTLAGPRVLEHIVDTVLYFEGDGSSSFRLIRAIKNRFGAVNELGVFGMTEFGLREVSNPSALFLSRHTQPVAGSCTTVTLEGTRPLAVEIQALLDESRLGIPRRLTVGLEQNRLALLLAVLHRHGGVSCADQDVFINAVAGVRIAEPAADLAILMALVSSLRNRPLPVGWVVFGEVGLAGEVRPVQRGVERLREAAKLGFKVALMPRANAPRQVPEGIRVMAVERVEEALQAWREEI
ncbi:MAG: DNA repair protein RadA [Betaproteobacteria bacterium]|jgi:DNA replication and repair protein RadA|nr:DNA repair protein RadA [Betaproteobacteria bacterium]